jgi:hypothetical protein
VTFGVTVPSTGAVLAVAETPEKGDIGGVDEVLV